MSESKNGMDRERLSIFLEQIADHEEDAGQSARIERSTDRVLARLGLDGAADGARIALEVELWLAEAELTSVRADPGSAVALPTRTVRVEDLPAVGYSPEVELEVDYHPSGASADLHVLLREESPGAAASWSVTVSADGPDGAERVGRIVYGHGTLRDVAVVDGRIPELRFGWSDRR